MTASMIYATIIYSLITVLGSIMSAAFTFKPDFGLKFSNSAAGVDLPAVAARDKESNRALKFLLGFSASQILGVDGLSLLIVLIPFRHHETWAWCALLYWPIMFVWHYIHYDKKSPLSKVQIVWFVLSFSALALTYPEFFS